MKLLKILLLLSLTICIFTQEDDFGFDGGMVDGGFYDGGYYDGGLYDGLTTWDFGYDWSYGYIDSYFYNPYNTYGYYDYYGCDYLFNSCCYTPSIDGLCLCWAGYRKKSASFRVKMRSKLTDKPNTKVPTKEERASKLYNELKDLKASFRKKDNTLNISKKDASSKKVDLKSDGGSAGRKVDLKAQIDAKDNNTNKAYSKEFLLLQMQRNKILELEKIVALFNKDNNNTATTEIKLLKAGDRKAETGKKDNAEKVNNSKKGDNVDKGSETK